MVFEEVKALIVKELNAKAENITMETKLADDLGADSLDAVEIILALEDKYGVEIDDEVAKGIKTVGDLVNYVEEHK